MILLQFIVEAVIVTVLGGALGVIAGVAAAMLANGQDFGTGSTVTTQVTPFSIVVACERVGADRAVLRHLPGVPGIAAGPHRGAAQGLTAARPGACAACRARSYPAAMEPHPIETIRHDSALGAWEMWRRAPHPALAPYILELSGWVERRVNAPTVRLEAPMAGIVMVLNFAKSYSHHRAGQPRVAPASTRASSRGSPRRRSPSTMTTSATACR